ISEQIASQMQQATSGVPFLVEESTRWLLSQGALMVQNGACVVNTETSHLDLQVEVGKGIVARAALQGEEGVLCLRLLSGCARTIELAHLRHAMGGENSPHKLPEKQPDLERVLAALEAEQFVIPVAGKRPRYALLHDRIRESLFDSLSPDERCQLQGRL